MQVKRVGDYSKGVGSRVGNPVGASIIDRVMNGVVWRSGENAGVYW